MKRLTQRACCWCWLAILSAAAQAQVFELSGGASSLYEAQGGSLLIRGKSYDASFGTGVVAGHFVGGARLTKSLGKAQLGVGSETILCNLPTDVFDDEHYLYGVGASVKMKIGRAKIFAFGGATSTNYGSPFFNGSRAGSPAAVLMVDKNLGTRLRAVSEMILSEKTTAIGSLEWKSPKGWTTAIAGGVGANSPYGAVSLSILKKTLDLKLEYVYTSPEFRRVTEANLYTPEPVRENVLATWRPSRWFSMSGGRQRYLSSLGDTKSVASTLDQGAINVDLRGLNLMVMGIRSNYAGHGNTSLVYTVGRQISRRVHVSLSEMDSRPDDGELSTARVGQVEESLSPRWTLNELLNDSNGQKTAGFGGAFLSNVATVSLDYQTYYVPSRAEAPFEQALIMDVSMNLGGWTGIHAGTFVSPTGKLLYTADMRQMISRDGTGSANSVRSQMGAMVLRGRVVDLKGDPVMGAALRIDQAALFTDSQGYFCLRERRRQTHQLQVQVSQFMDGGRYRVVSAPERIQSGVEGDGAEALIVVAPLPG